MDSSGYHQQQQQQQPQPESQGYDPSQTLPYDQSSQPDYAYNYQYDNQPQFQQEPSPVHPPGVPIEPPHSAGPSQTQQLNPVQGARVAGSFNPAAVAVVAGALAQLVGNADGVPREPIGPSQYRGRGRRGGRPFRGIGRGLFNHYRGRGRSRGGDDGQLPSYSSGPSISNVADAPAAAGATSEMQPSSVSGQSLLPNPVQVPAALLQATPGKLWCEICKAECNTPEMLEQHKNGKRHRKNLLVHEELQRRKAISGQQSGNISTSQSNLTIQPENVQESEKKGLPEENKGGEATADNLNDETELQHNVEGVSEVQAEESQVEAGDNSAVQGHGFKRKIRGGRGGKYMRSSDGSRKPVESKQVTSFICELCNVKCDSQVVYNSHLTGKKHLSNFKRVHGHQALNVEAGIQPLHPPDINALSNLHNFPVQQCVSDPQVLLAQLLMTVLSRVQAPATAPQSGPVAAQIQAPTSLAGSSHEALSQNLSLTQVSDSLPHFESENLILQLDATAGTSNNGDTETADGRPATVETMLNLPQDSSVMTPAENPVAANEQVPSML